MKALAIVKEEVVEKVAYATAMQVGKALTALTPSVERDAVALEDTAPLQGTAHVVLVMKELTAVITSVRRSVVGVEEYALRKTTHVHASQTTQGATVKLVRVAFDHIHLIKPFLHRFRPLWTHPTLSQWRKLFQ